MSSSSWKATRANELIRSARQRVRARERNQSEASDSDMPPVNQPQGRSSTGRRLILEPESDEEERTSPPRLYIPMIQAPEPPIPIVPRPGPGFLDSLRREFRPREQWQSIELSSAKHSETDKGKRVASPSESEEETSSGTQIEGDDMDVDPVESEEKNQHNQAAGSGEKGAKDDWTDEKREIIKGLMESGYTMEDALYSYAETQAELKGKDKKIDSKRAYAALRKMPFEGTIYPHRDTMEQLQIARDVDMLLGACGLNHIMYTPSGCTREETLQFLASVQVRLYDEITPALQERDGGGYITFTVNQRLHRFTLRRLQELFQFHAGAPEFHNIDEEEIDDVWSMLTGEECFKVSRAKGNNIRNPCINYMRRAVANVLFARPTTAPITLGEMQILVQTMKEIVGETHSGRQIEGDDANASMAYILAMNLTTYRTRAETLAKKGGSKPISIGGVVFRILEACNVGMDRSEWIAPRFMDVEYLKRSLILSKKDKGLIYKFNHPEDPDCQVALPRPDITSIRLGQNAEFSPPLSTLAAPPTQPQAQEEPATDEDDIDPESLFFEEFTAPKLGVPTKEAHKRINLLQKVGKWLVKKVKGLTKEKAEWKREREELRREMDALKERFGGETSRETRAQPPIPAKHSSGDGSLVYRRRHRGTRRGNSTSQLEFQPLESTPSYAQVGYSSAQLESQHLESEHAHTQMPDSSAQLGQPALESAQDDASNYASESMLDFGF